MFDIAQAPWWAKVILSLILSGLVALIGTVAHTSDRVSSVEAHIQEIHEQLRAVNHKMDILISRPVH